MVAIREVSSFGWVQFVGCGGIWSESMGSRTDKFHLGQVARFAHTLTMLSTVTPFQRFPNGKDIVAFRTMLREMPVHLRALKAEYLGIW